MERFSNNIVKLLISGWFTPFLTLADQNGVGEFKAPDGWYQDGVVFESNQNTISIFACFIRKAPCQGYRSINHDTAQCRRPSFTMSRRRILPRFTRLRSARIPSTIS